MLCKDNRKHLQLGSVAHAFNPAFGRQGQADIWEFEASLDYRVNSKTVRAAQRNPLWGGEGEGALVSSGEKKED